MKKNTLVRVEKDTNFKITIKYDWCIQITLKVKKTIKEHFSIGGSETTIQSTVSEATKLEQLCVRQCLLPPAIKF